MKSRFGTLAVRGVVASAAIALLAASPAPAQQRGDMVGDAIIDAAGARGLQDHNASAARRAMGFQLFASRDAAGAGAHLPGNMAYAMDNYSPCDAPFTGFCEWELHPSRNPAATTFQFFEVLWFAGAPPSEWIKIRNVAPAVGNAKGGGYVALMNFALFRPQLEWGPADGTLSTLFSGVTSTDDGGCQDNGGFSNGFFPDGLPLLALSNCTATWPGSGWGGDRTAPVESWLSLWQAQGTAFEFNPLQMPDAMKREGLFMGTNFSTYGKTSDHYLEQLEAYGSAIPGGTGDPTFEGYPLGLDIRWEGFSFGVPSLAGVQFTRATVINRSEDVYGTGVDYDSLYFGLAPGTGGSGAGGGQRFSDYYLPGISAGIYHQSKQRGDGGPCGDGSRIPSGVSSCTSSNTANGYNNGGNAIVILRSPIGDQRNKLFTRTASGSPCLVGVDAFCDPTHPLADDTITFNHGHQCGFGGCWASTHNVNDKRSFGMISSQEDLVIDGRDPASLSGSEAWRTFRNFDYPNVVGKFNYWIPGAAPGFGSWDWNNDGVQDTLRFDSCHINGCVVLSADTAPGGQLNTYGNVGGVLSAGPFALAAGDSTVWWMAFVGDQDSTTLFSGIEAALDLYLNFFLAPDAPPPTTIASTQVGVATDATGNLGPSVTMFFTEDPEKWVDPFITKLANDLEAAPAGTPNFDLVAANPTLIANLRARAADNLQRIEIYKSCNGGGSFTSDADCIGDPATDELGKPAGLGWEAYAVLDVDANGGDIPNAFTDDAVQGGLTYLYTFVAKSRGATFLITDPVTLAPMEVEFSPSIRNTLSRSSSDPNVISVFVPASNQAGFVAAEASFNVEGGTATVPFSIAFADNVTPGNYVVRFGNQFIVERDSNITTDAVETRVTAQRTVLANGGVTTVVSSAEYVRTDDAVVPVAGSASSSATTTVGDIVRTTDTYTGLGFVAAGGTQPIFVSQTLSGTGATPTSVFALPDFPGFSISADNGPAGDYNTAGEFNLRGELGKARFGTTADTIQRATSNSGFIVNWRQTNSSDPSEDGGRYSLVWADDPFGLTNGIAVNFTNPDATGAELQAALAARVVGTTGLTDAETATVAGVVQSELVAVKMPFTVENVTFGRTVDIAMERRFSDTYVLGSNADTARVEIPADQWVPGDALIFIETITEDSVDAAGDVVLAGGIPLQTTRRAVTFSEAIIGCDQPAPPACNPVGVGERGQSGFLPHFAGDALEWEYYVGFDATTLFDFDLVAPVSGTSITAVTDSALEQIRVVPNPFIVLSNYQTDLAASRVLFTNVPPTGTLRFYTVSGQFVQQVNWTPDDLSGSGDLFYNLKSREDIDIATGLYIWVLTAPSDPTNASSRPITARGKFVVIRGKPR